MRPLHFRRMICGDYSTYSPRLVCATKARCLPRGFIRIENVPFEAFIAIRFGKHDA
jgi:hypothetical protein